MNQGLQQIADRLAEVLGRSVEIDDRNLLPLAVTEQSGALDEVRIQSVLQRRSSQAVRDYIFSYDIEGARGPLRYPANEELQSLPRVCIPLRHSEKTYGFLWLIDSPELSKEDMAAALETAGLAADALYEQETRTVSDLDREAKLVRRVVETVTPQAPAEESGLFSFEEALTVVYMPLRVGNQPAPMGFLRSLTQQVSFARPVGRSLLGYTTGAAQLVLPAALAGDRLRPFRREVERWASGNSGKLLPWGIGGDATAYPQLQLVAAQAKFAADLAVAQGLQGSSWHQLGTDIAFFGLDRNLDTMKMLFPQIEGLLRPENFLLRETLEAFLEAGSDTGLAARQLSIHRTTFYYRLDKARTLLGDAWAEGQQRLGLHLALRLSRIMEAEERS